MSKNLLNDKKVLKEHLTRNYKVFSVKNKLNWTDKQIEQKVNAQLNDTQLLNRHLAAVRFKERMIEGKKISDKITKELNDEFGIKNADLNGYGTIIYSRMDLSGTPEAYEKNRNYILKLYDRKYASEELIKDLKKGLKADLSKYIVSNFDDAARIMNENYEDITTFFSISRMFSTVGKYQYSKELAELLEKNKVCIERCAQCNSVIESFWSPSFMTIPNEDPVLLMNCHKEFSKNNADLVGVYDGFEFMQDTQLEYNTRDSIIKRSNVALYNMTNEKLLNYLKAGNYPKGLLYDHKCLINGNPAKFEEGFMLLSEGKTGVEFVKLTAEEMKQRENILAQGIIEEPDKLDEATAEKIDEKIEQVLKEERDYEIDQEASQYKYDSETTDIQEEIDKDFDLEDNYKEAAVNYKKDDHLYDASQNEGASLEQYAEYRNPLGMPTSGVGVFLDTMKLKDGVSNVYCNPADFNKALKKVFENEFYTKITEYYSDEQYVTKGERRITTLPVDSISKQGLLQYAKEKRGFFFNYLLGNGNPSIANPKFVKMINETDNGITRKRLAYDNKEINKLVKDFNDDKKLYKLVSSCFPVGLFKKIYDRQTYVMDGNNLSFGEGIDGLKNSAHLFITYRSLRDIHNARSVGYMLRHPLKYHFESSHLGKLKKDILKCADYVGLKNDAKSALKAKDGLDFDYCIYESNLKKALCPDMDDLQIEDALSVHLKEDKILIEPYSKRLEAVQATTIIEQQNNNSEQVKIEERQQITIDTDEQKDVEQINTNSKETPRELETEGMNEKDWA